MRIWQSFFVHLSVAMTAVVASPACSSADRPSVTADSREGTVTFQLLTGGERLDTVEMRIYAGTTTAGRLLLDKSLDVHSFSSTISVFVQGLPPGDYLVDFAAKAVNTGDLCDGQQIFHIDTRQTHVVFVTILCGSGVATATGNELVNARLVAEQPCPYLRNVTVAPLQVGVGDAVELSAGSSDQEGTLTWASDVDGTFSNPGALDASYTCASAGAKTISASLTRPSSACFDSVSVPVVCVGDDGAPLP